MSIEPQTLYDFLDFNIYVFILICFFIFLFIFKDHKQIKKILDILF